LREAAHLREMLERALQQPTPISNRSSDTNSSAPDADTDTDPMPATVTTGAESGSLLELLERLVLPFFSLMLLFCRWDLLYIP